MSPEKFKKVEEIYHAVLKASPDERVSIINDLSGDDAEIRREIESLLSHEKDFDNLLDTPPDTLAAEIVSLRSDSDIIGNQINQYKILSLLGEGGMGAVYLAQDTKLERKVAVKLLSGDFSREANRRNRFFQEAKSASALNHPSIITVHEIGELDGAYFIVTEYIDGRTLKRYLSEENPPLQSVLEIAAQVASALSAAHEAGIVHRDIKPDNIMVRNDGIVKVLDFGIAKLNDTGNSTEMESEAQTRAQPMTLPGMIIGTPQYMSPEQARGQKVDQRTDIFSFGVLLYEIISGKPPFGGSTNMDVIGSILKDEPKALCELLPEIPPQLDHIVEKTLRKDREQRYQNIKDLLIDLNDVRKNLEFSTRKIHRTDSENARATVEETAGIATQPRFSFLHVSLFLLLLTGAAFAVYWRLAPRETIVQKAADLKTVEVANWSSSPGEIYSVGSFSPDAKMVAFASTRNGGKNIWVKQTVSGEAIQITKDEFGNDDPIWSPNGEELAFFSTKGNKAGIWRIPGLGGSAVFIAEIKDGSSQLKFWSKQNRIYYELKGEIYAIDAASGQITQITDFASKGLDTKSPCPSPDENKIAFVSAEEKSYTLWTADLKGETPQKLYSSAEEIRNVVWHPDNRRIFYSAPVDGTFQIFVTDIDGAPPQQLTFAETDYLVLNVSADGTRILYGSAKEESDIWGVSVKDFKEYGVAADIDSELWADVSPDGKFIAYQSIKNLSQGNKIANGNILTRNLSDREKETLLVSNSSLPQWSPDGKTLAFLRWSGNKYQIETINAVGGGQKLLTKEGVASVSFTVLPYNRVQESDFSWSPDNRKIAYVSYRNGQYNIWLIGADGSNDEQLTTNDSNLIFSCPLWSSDGKRIAYTSRTNNVEGKPTYFVSVIDPETKRVDPIFSDNTFLRLVGWTQSGKELLLASVEGSGFSGMQKEVSMLLLPVETRKTTEIARLKETYLFNIRLSADKKSIAFAAHRDGTDNIWIIPATGGAEKKLTSNNDSRLYFSSLAWSPDGSSIFFGKQSRYSLLSMLTNFK